MGIWIDGDEKMAGETPAIGDRDGGAPETEGDKAVGRTSKLLAIRRGNEHLLRDGVP
jgi:hypothetical protein